MRITAALVPLLMVGCTVGPNYRRPPISAPGSYTHPNVSSTTPSADIPGGEAHLAVGMLSEDECVAGAVSDGGEPDRREVRRATRDLIPVVGEHALTGVKLRIVPLIDERARVARVAGEGHRDGRTIPSVFECTGVPQVSDFAVARAPKCRDPDAADGAIGSLVNHDAAVQGVEDITPFIILG